MIEITASEWAQACPTDRTSHPPAGKVAWFVMGPKRRAVIVWTQFWKDAIKIGSKKLGAFTHTVEARQCAT